MNNLKKTIFFVLVCNLCAAPGYAAALGDQWYIGLGAGSTFLQPNPLEEGIDIERRLGVGGALFFGVDLDDRSSGQLTLYPLGDAELDNDAADLVAFQAFDGSVLYRFYDSKDARLRRSGMHLALYGRFALGFLRRETDVKLINDSAVYFGAGAGAEWFINRAFSIRLEGMYLDKDAAIGSIQFVGRFGGKTSAPSRPRPLPADKSTDTVNAADSAQPNTPAVSVPVVPVVPPGPSEAPGPVDARTGARTGGRG